MDEVTIKLIADIISFVAMGLVAVSYFVRNKIGYLLFQSLGIVFLILSYLFSGLYVAMLGLSVGLIRTITFFLYENKGKKAPIVWSFIFSAMTICSYFFAKVLGTVPNQFDVLNIIALCMYAFIFRIRDIRVVKFCMLVPTILSILYNILSHAPIFNAVSYSIEFIANIASIIMYYAIMDRKRRTKR